MRAVMVAAAAVLLASISLAARAQGPSPQDAQLPDALDHWRRSTVSIGQVVNDGGTKKYVSMGSAVIVATDEHHGCLLTAKHMVLDESKGYIPTTMSIRLPKDKPTAGEDLGIGVQLVINGQNTWKSLPDKNVDLAVVPLPDLSSYHDVHGVSTRDFGNADDTFQGATILVLGYPVILGQDYLSTPLARGGITSWVDPTGPTEKRFLIDANMFNGSSGGPVFRLRTGFNKSGGLALGGGLALIGIIIADAAERAPVVVESQQIQAIDPATGKTLRAEAIVLNIGGIGIVEPVSKARELVEANCR